MDGRPHSGCWSTLRASLDQAAPATSCVSSHRRSDSSTRHVSDGVSRPLTILDAGIEER